MRVEFVKGETTRYRSVVHRPDGVTIEFEGGSYNRIGGRPGRVPHDLAHLVVESELGLTAGVWGTLAAGGLFRHATVIAGRQKPHATARGRALVNSAHGSIMLAELHTRRVCDVMLGERPLGAAMPQAMFDRCAARLRAGAVEWAALPPGGRLAVEWRPAPASGT